LLALMVGAAPASAQVKEDLSFIIQRHAPVQASPAGTATPSFGRGSELRSVTLGVIGFYQRFISPQDVQVCNFTVSCSRFSVRAIEKFGVVHGILMTSDRLQRCNGLRASYRADPKTGLAIDFPLESYRLGRVK